MKLHKYDYGDRVCCELKNYTGIIYVKSEYATGCIQYGIQVDDDDINSASLVFEDEGTLTVIEEQVLTRELKRVDRYDFK